MKGLQIPQKLGYEKFCVHEKILRTRNCRRKFIKIYFLKNAKKTCKPNNRDINRDWIKELTVIDLRNKNKQNVISYRQIKKIENISCAEISKNCNLLVAHIILNNLVHIIRRWVYLSRHVTITNFNCKTKNRRTQIESRGSSNTSLGPGLSDTDWGRGSGLGPEARARARGRKTQIPYL